jgi:hypothetical protein
MRPQSCVEQFDCLLPRALGIAENEAVVTNVDIDFASFGSEEAAIVIGMATYRLCDDGVDDIHQYLGPKA